MLPTPSKRIEGVGEGSGGYHTRERLDSSWGHWRKHRMSTRETGKWEGEKVLSEENARRFFQSREEERREGPQREDVGRSEAMRVRVRV